MNEVVLYTRYGSSQQLMPISVEQIRDCYESAAFNSMAADDVLLDSDVAFSGGDKHESKREGFENFGGLSRAMYVQDVNGDESHG